MRTDANERLCGQVFATVGKFLSFRECHSRIQDKWPCPAEHVLVEWLASASPPAHDTNLLDALARLGFQDPSVGLRHRPVETTVGILPDGSGTLADDLELLIDEHGNPVAATSDVDADNDDWSTFL